MVHTIVIPNIKHRMTVLGSRPPPYRQESRPHSTQRTIFLSSGLTYMNFIGLKVLGGIGLRCQKFVIVLQCMCNRLWICYS